MRCLSLQQMMEFDMVLKTDPDDDIPAGHEVVGKLSQTKKLSQPAINNIISLFDNLSEAHAHMSTATANLSSIGKIVDAETFYMILRVSIRPMVQLTIPECFLNPIQDPNADTLRDTMMHKIEWDLLPKGDKPILVKEPDNGPTRLLCAVQWIKLSRLFLNKGMQKDAAMIFCIREKQLSRLLTGCKYWGSTDHTTEKRPGEKKNGKKLKRKKGQKSETVTKPCNDDEDDNGPDKGLTPGKLIEATSQDNVKANIYVS